MLREKENCHIIIRIISGYNKINFMTRIKSDYNCGDIVYLNNDPEQNQYYVVGIIGRFGTVLLELNLLGDTIEAYEMMVSKEKNIKMSMGIDEKEEE